MIYHCEPESKQQSTDWKNPQFPSKEKFKKPTFQRKIDAYSFWALTLSGEGHNNKQCSLQ
jgi:hypothetical protein